ncbi:MAG: hypothetical protein JNM19_15725, partial [Chitinophagaceae bacterium]|nr:hypothetical protein [Chitinophagaceae bacterium]
RITGMTFPHKDAPVFVRLRNEKQTEECWMTTIAENDQALYGFLPVDTALRGDVEFGYGDTVIAIFKSIKWELTRRLEDAKVEKDVIAVNKEWLKKMRASRKKGM